MRDGSKFKFVVDDNLLYCLCIKSNSSHMLGKEALVVSAQCRKMVISTSHEAPLAGHFGHQKTDLRLRKHFFWPSVTEDVRNYCQSCNVCQKMGPKGRESKLPLKPMPIITDPFSRVAVYIVRPVLPHSAQANRYGLTTTDFTTGFPEAVPLKDID